MSDQPVVEAYLADLDRALTGSDPREHAEVLEGVREHLAQALPEGADPAHVRHVLAELGPVEAIAAAASPAAAQPGAPAGTDWFAVSTLAAAVVGALVLVPAPFAAIPVALVALVSAVVHLRTRRTHPAMVWTALVVAVATLVSALLLAMTLMVFSGGGAPVPGPVQGVEQG